MAAQGSSALTASVTGDAELIAIHLQRKKEIPERFINRHNRSRFKILERQKLGEHISRRWNRPIYSASFCLSRISLSIVFIYFLRIAVSNVFLTGECLEITIRDNS